MREHLTVTAGQRLTTFASSAKEVVRDGFIFGV